MARQDLAPEDRDKTPLQLPQLLDCPECDTTQDEVFQAPDGVFDAEDLIDAPTKTVACSNCGHVWKATYEGWHEHESAG